MRRNQQMTKFQANNCHKHHKIQKTNLYFYLPYLYYNFFLRFWSLLWLPLCLKILLRYCF